jgi:predicted RNA-binding Zn-ribbon protein involved in translation (DUF1610 family)
MSKKCILCGGVDIKQNGSYADGSKSFECRNCGEVFILQTVFHRITASPEVLAEKLVYSIKIISGCEIMYSSNVLDVCYDTKEKAIRATVEKLKEVCNE